MDIHVLTPFYRDYLAPTLIHYLEPMGIIWHPIVTVEERWPTVAQAKGHKKQKYWIHPLVVPKLAPGMNAFKKINDFIEMRHIVDDDYYGFMCDDNMYSPNFFDVIRQQTAKILMFSMYRGDTVPDRKGEVPHHATTLRIAEPWDVRHGNIDIMQYIIKGEIFRKYRFDVYDHAYSDGHYAERLKFQHPDDIQFLPNLYCFFNYFQPGRYTDPSKFLDPTWKMPKFV